LLRSPLSRIDPVPPPNFGESETTTMASGILIVEDERIVAKDIQQMVSGLGYPVVGIAASGEGAVQKANMLRPALILMDIWLPGAIDGIRAADEIRQILDVPVIYLTALSDTETVRRAASTEPFGYILKPVKEIELRCAIQVALHKHRAETLLRERERLLATTLGSIGDGVITTDADESVMFLNRVAERLTGWQSIEARGRKLSQVLHLRTEATGELAADPMREALLSGETTCPRTETTLSHRRSGSIIPIDQCAAPIKNDWGRVLGGVMVVRDISEKKKAAAERERLLRCEQNARAEAEAANRLKDEFLATVSHELRTPLSAIMGWLRMLAAGTLDAAASSRALETISRCAVQQAHLVEDLLDVSRIETRSLQLDIQPVELVSIVDTVIEALRPAAELKALHWRKTLDPEAGPVGGDPTRLQQIASNLVSNAVKFTPAGGSIEVRLERAGSLARLVVTDSGPGIAPDFLPHVFDRFRKADASSTQQVGGLGLGLAIVRQLVELQGGTVAAESEGVGRGATFTVSFPIMAVQQERRQRPPSSPGTISVDRRIGPAPRQLSGVSVLLVDDDAGMRELLKAIFTPAGADVRAAACSTEALDMLAEIQPNVIICDIGMPKEDGYFLIQKIRRLSDAQGGRIPAIALTAYGRPEDRRQCLLAGFQAYLAKPAGPEELVALVADLAGRTPVPSDSESRSVIDSDQPESC
jgi:PAS domain S-box-containing protein